MNFEDIRVNIQVNWEQYPGQSDNGVTYLIVAPRPISRLRGKSDILYVGYTDSDINSRFDQETKSVPSNARGSTNTRLTYVLQQLKGWKYFFVKGKNINLPREHRRKFNLTRDAWTSRKKWSRLTFEKYLLIWYAEDHLELPPLNNRF